MIAIKTKMEMMPKNCWHCNHRNICSYFMVHGCLFNGDRPSKCSLVEIEEHKTGKWIYEYDNGVSAVYHCSVCGRKLAVLRDDTVENYPYCHCGTKMDL